MIDKANLGNNLMKLGMGMASMGLMYGIAKDMNRGCGCGSIFGGGYGMGMGMGCYPGGMMGMTNPMMMGGMGMMGMGNPMMMGGMGMINPYMMSSMNMTNPFQMFSNSNQRNSNVAPKLDYDKANRVSRDTDTTQGKELEAATKKMVDADTNQPTNVSFSFVSDEWKELASKKDKTAAENRQLSQEYKNSVSDLAKSYLMQMDTVGGNKNGELSADEFVEYSLRKDLPANIEKDDKNSKEVQQATNYARIAFTKLDQNQDGIVDWKETAAMLYAADMGTDSNKVDYNKQNGKISAADLNNFTTDLVTEDVNSADDKLRKGYMGLFNAEQ